MTKVFPRFFTMERNGRITGIKTTDAKSRDMLILPPSKEESEKAGEWLLWLVDQSGAYTGLSQVLDTMMPEKRERVFEAVDRYRAKDRQSRTADSEPNAMRRMNEETARTIAKMNAAAKEAWGQ
jgi:hypothetical protein